MASPPSEHTSRAPDSDARAAGRLRGNSIGTGHIVFFVISAAAPLSGVVLAFPVILGMGNGIGIPGAFVVATVILLIFAVGYTAMSRHIVNAGGFFTFVTQGLGRVAGLGTATLAIFSYTAIQAGMFGALGAFVGRVVDAYSGPSIPWWVYAVVGVLACLFLGVREVKVGARALGVMLALETSLILVLDVVVLFTGGASGGGPLGLSLEPFSPVHVFSGALGIALIFAYNTFIGFEATTIYGEEAIDPKRTVPRATYIAVTAMGVFYAATAWLLVNAFGTDVIVGLAQDDPEALASTAIGNYLGALAADLMGLLIVTSIFAAVLAFHNTLARYLYALSRQEIIWPALARTGRNPTPYGACTVQAASALIIVAGFALAGSDPYTQVFVWASGIGSVGVILLQTVASIAVFTFFRRHDVDRRPWHTLIAPVLSMLGLVSLAAIALGNFQLLVGATGPATVVLLAGLLVLAALVGAGRAWWLRTGNPTVYDRIGTTADGVEVEQL